VEFLSSREESRPAETNHITQSVLNQAKETFGAEFTAVEDDELPF
jgi:hypothetical protein